MADWKALAGTLGLADRITFAGARSDVPRWLAVLDVLVCPSLQESFGLVAVEAQMARVPVVATRVDGFLETLHDGVDALLAPPGDVVALCVAIKTTLRSPDLAKRLVDAGWRNASTRFAIERTAEAYAGLYRELLSSGERRAQPDCGSTMFCGR